MPYTGPGGLGCGAWAHASAQLLNELLGSSTQVPVLQEYIFVLEGDGVDPQGRFVPWQTGGFCQLLQYELGPQDIFFGFIFLLKTFFDFDFFAHESRAARDFKP